MEGARGRLKKRLVVKKPYKDRLTKPAYIYTVPACGFVLHRRNKFDPTAYDEFRSPSAVKPLRMRRYRTARRALEIHGVKVEISDAQ